MIRFSDTVTVSRVDEELVLLDSRSGKYFGLNAVGRRIFELLSENPNRKEALETLLTEYDVEEGQLRADIDRFLVELKSKGLVETDEV
jgi:PqqD family protein of HPr-rel-A system